MTPPSDHTLRFLSGCRENAPVEDRLAGILDHRQAVALGDRQKLAHVCHVSGEMYRNDRLGPRRDLSLDLAHIHAESVVAIDKDRRRPDLGDRAHCGDEGVGCRNDFVAVTDIERPERQLDCIGSRIHADGVFRPDQVRESALKIDERLAQGEIARRYEVAKLLPKIIAIGELLAQIGISNTHGAAALNSACYAAHTRRVP